MMTQAGIRRPRQDPNARRPGLIYGFRILNPETGGTPIDYVGKTVQELSARESQHRGPAFDVDDSEQPWSDLIVGKPVVLEQGTWTAAELDAREQHWIRERIKPRYNYEFNLDNPNRIPIYEARRQREERDRAAGRVSPTWGRAKPTSTAVTTAASPRRTVGRRPARVEAGPFQTWAFCLTLLGPVVAILAWLTLRIRVGLPTGQSLRISLAVTVGVFLAAPVAWWLFKQSRRRTRRKVVGWTAGAVAFGLLWLFWPLVSAHLPSSVLAPVPARPAVVTHR